MATLTEEEIDDILYFSRVNELEEFKQTLAEIKTAKNYSEVDILKAAVDSETGNTALHYASANGHIEITKHILSSVGAQRELVETTQDAPAPTPSPELRTFLNTQNKSGNTVLHWAALNGQVDTLLLLLQQGADPSILNEAGHDALFEAELNEKTKAAEVLLAEGKELESTVNANGAGREKDSESEDEEDGEDIVMREGDLSGMLD